MIDNKNLRLQENMTSISAIVEEDLQFFLNKSNH